MRTGVCLSLIKNAQQPPYTNVKEGAVITLTTSVTPPPNYQHHPPTHPNNDRRNPGRLTGLSRG